MFPRGIIYRERIVSYAAVNGIVAEKQPNEIENASSRKYFSRAIFHFESAADDFTKPKIFSSLTGRTMIINTKKVVVKRVAFDPFIRNIRKSYRYNFFKFLLCVRFILMWNP